jgi:mannose-6-phosphate isomerase-like protein (cupin superfamily)
MKICDNGPKPFAINIEKATVSNCNYRTTIWTGKNLQATLMCIPSGCEVGLEVHPDNDQFLRVESGKGMAVMGPKKDRLNFQCPVNDGSAIFVPAGAWHNILNTGCNSLKLYAIYAPPHHPHGTVHNTICDAQEEEMNENKPSKENKPTPKPAEKDEFVEKQ